MLNDYINQTWTRLLRNSLDVALDPKVKGDARTFLYVPPGEDVAAINEMIVERRKHNEHLGAIEVRVLPEDLTVTEDHGILYLPHDYIVPGGRFNEMYGWDSYWIILGLMAQGHAALARGMVDNFVYQIRHYGGKILNANRTYYLSRSQPPLLAAMAMAVLPGISLDGRADYLQRVADACALEYESFWKTNRFNKNWGLFHYGNIEQGALGLCPETSFGERDETGLSHYDKIAAYLHELPVGDALRRRFYDEEKNGLSLEAMAGDRAMRESGFDASMHMGYYGLQTMDYSPVCLNSLLYVQCQLLAQMFSELQRSERASYFAGEAELIKAGIHKTMWNQETKLFANFNHYENRHSDFPYLTCVYPLWAGIATPEQAWHFRENLALFETAFGLRGTNQQTGCQWDAPFMWAPLVYFAVAGLANYGFIDDARRIAGKYNDTVQRVFDVSQANFEKYNADTGGMRTEGIVEVGYSENVVGFGWTNGTALALQNWLRLAPQSAPQQQRSVASFDVLLWEKMAQHQPVAA